jgi:ubiquitin C-terminal hydrolase
MYLLDLTINLYNHILPSPSAQELLNDLLDALHEDSNKVVKKPYVEALEDQWVESHPLSRVGEESWKRYVI